MTGTGLAPCNIGRLGQLEGREIVGCKYSYLNRLNIRGGSGPARLLSKASKRPARYITNSEHDVRTVPLETTTNQSDVEFVISSNM